MDNEAPRMELKVTSINSHPLGIIVYLEGVGKVDSHFCCTEDYGAGGGPYKELDDGVVRLILLWFRHPQQAGQETVPLVHSVAWEIQGYGDH